MIYVDVGANIGSHVINAGRLVGEHGMVFAFEADPDTCALLERNILLNELNNVMVQNECVLDVDGYVTFYLSEDTAKSSLLQNRTADEKRTISIHRDTLDNLLPELSKIDLLKIDVEGADFMVLRGASKIFDEKPPAIVAVEIHDVDSYNKNSLEVLQFLQARHYNIYSFVNNRLLKLVPEDRGNVYAVHATAKHAASQFL